MDRLNQWLTLLANVGVIVGIAFLVVEIRQNDQMLLEDQRLREASAFLEMEAQYMEASQQISSNKELAELLARTRSENATFTRAELVMLTSFMSQYARIDHTAYRFWTAGHLSEAAWTENARAVEQHRASETLLSRLYMMTFVSMPEDIKEYFNIAEYPRELLDLEAFLKKAESDT